MESSATINALFEFATEGMLVADSRGRIIKINPSAERMFGYLKGELNDALIEILIPSRFSGSHVAHRDGFNKNPHPRSMGQGMELFGKKKDNSEFPVEISLSPFVATDGNFVIAFIVDITERRKAEEKIKNYSIELEKQVQDRTLILREAIDELEKTKDELKKALEKEMELNDMKSRFVSIASHEFRTPLATILSSLSLVSKYNERNEEEKKNKHINRIKSAVNNMTDILNDLLSLSKLEEGKVQSSPEYFDLGKMVDELVQEMQGIAKGGQRIVHKKLDPCKEVFLDKKLVKNIFFNLISNAIKFSAEGEEIEVGSRCNGELVEITVTDHGIGIPKADQENLFERFYRGQNATNIQGTGLGLSIIKKYTELMNGSITYESEENKGTKFMVKLKNETK